MPRSCHKGYVQVPSLVLIARVVFLLERGHTVRQTDKVTDATDHPNGELGMGNEQNFFRLLCRKPSAT